MKDFSSLMRLAFAVLALPLAATAAVSAMSAGETPESASVRAIRAVSASRMMASHRNHSVSIDSAGIVRGRVVGTATNSVSGLSDMKVFFIRDGEIASQVYSREDGSFEATGLSEGDYSFVATGANGFAAFGLRATSGQNTETNNLIEVGTVSPKFERVMQILDGKLPVAVVEEIIRSTGSEKVPAGANRVEVVDGKLTGNLSTLAGDLQDAMIYLVKGNQKVAEATPASSGAFEIAGIEPGMYEFVATSRNGMAALSFEAVRQEEGSIVSEQPISGSVVSNNASFDSAAPVQNLDVAMTMPQDGTIVGEQFGHACDSCGVASNATYTEPYAFAGTEVGCGAAAGGSCGSSGDWGGYSGCGCGGGGGGGAFGGGGGLASLARFAILGWVLTELFQEIDFSDNNNNASPNNT